MNFQGEIYLKGTNNVSLKLLIIVSDSDWTTGFKIFKNFHFIEFLDEKHFFT